MDRYKRQWLWFIINPDKEAYCIKEIPCKNDLDIQKEETLKNKMREKYPDYYVVGCDTHNYESLRSFINMCWDIIDELGKEKLMVFENLYDSLVNSLDEEAE